MATRHAHVLDDVPTGEWTVLTIGAVPVAPVVSTNASPRVPEARRGLRRGHVSASGAPSRYRRIATDWNRFPLTGGLYHPPAEGVNCVAPRLRGLSKRTRR